MAYAVPRLGTANVAISDTDGNVYSNDETLGRLTKQEEYRLNRERQLADKAQAMLVNFLGVGNSRVEVTADFSFPEGTTIIKEFDPDKRVVSSETIDSTTTTGENPVAAGPAEHRPIQVAERVAAVATTSLPAKPRIWFRPTKAHLRNEMTSNLLPF